MKKAFGATCAKRDTVFDKAEADSIMGKIKNDSGLEEMWNRFKDANYYVDQLSWKEVVKTMPPIW